MTILGTRPEVIRLSLICRELDKFSDHMVVHTGQNYTHNLNSLFYETVFNLIDGVGYYRYRAIEFINEEYLDWIEMEYKS